MDRHKALLDLSILLDGSTALAPVRGTAVLHLGPRNPEALADFDALEHDVDPAAAREEVDAAVDQAVVVDHVCCCHGGVALSFGRLSDHYMILLAGMIRG